MMIPHVEAFLQFESIRKQAFALSSGGNALIMTPALDIRVQNCIDARLVVAPCLAEKTSALDGANTDGKS
jgi:hypothetical protein